MFSLVISAFFVIFYLWLRNSDTRIYPTKESYLIHHKPHPTDIKALGKERAEEYNRRLRTLEYIYHGRIPDDELYAVINDYYPEV